jgi:hypothetical protein
VSDPVVVDHTTPVMAGADVAGGVLRVTIRDSANPLREAMVSTDAGEWRPVRSADGLLDGRSETLLIDLPKAAPATSSNGNHAAGNGEPGLLLLRVSDAAYNVVTFDLTRHGQ